MSAKPEANTTYATKVAIPRRLYQVALDNARLISQVTLDAYIRLADPKIQPEFAGYAVL